MLSWVNSLNRRGRIESDRSERESHDPSVSLWRSVGIYGRPSTLVCRVGSFFRSNGSAVRISPAAPDVFSVITETIVKLALSFAHMTLRCAVSRQHFAQLFTSNFKYFQF
jgi:hypothetical protein